MESRKFAIGVAFIILAAALAGTVAMTAYGANDSSDMDNASERAEYNEIAAQYRAILADDEIKGALHPDDLLVLTSASNGIDPAVAEKLIKAIIDYIHDNHVKDKLVKLIQDVKAKDWRSIVMDDLPPLIQDFLNIKEIVKEILGHPTV